MSLKSSSKSLARIIKIEFLTSSLGNLFKAVFIEVFMATTFW